ncbi:hypothetical protein GOBAR_DD03391 [Gossypium barbadense]|nr:hypothetical protein GOBAR_DD03391 [Gossypium barbadense]
MVALGDMNSNRPSPGVMNCFGTSHKKPEPIGSVKCLCSEVGPLVRALPYIGPPGQASPYVDPLSRAPP